MSTLSPRGDAGWRGGIDDPSRALERKVRASRGIILFERVWRALLWPFAVAAIFVILSLLGAFTVVSDLTHKVLIGLFAVVGLASLAPLFRIRLPSREDALRRLERDSGLRHRPATSYEDVLPVGASPRERALWEAHRQRLARLFDRLRVDLPRPRLDEADPYALRSLLALLLAVALIASSGSHVDRLGEALSLAPQQSAPQFRLDAWVTPPVYTGKPPIVLADGIRAAAPDEAAAQELTVPERSVLLVRINGESGARPLLEWSPEANEGGEALQPSRDDGRLAEYKVTLTRDRTLTVRTESEAIARWSFKLLADALPSAKFVQDPTATPRGALRLEYRVEDDYGVANAEASFTLAEKDALTRSSTATESPDQAEDKAAAEPLFPPPVVPLPLPRANAKLAEGKTYKDLTKHPWAGLKVKLRLVARDQAGQIGESKEFELVLPARKFRDPLAKAIVEQRRRLVMDPRTRPSVADALSALTIAPERFIDDRTVYLGLRTAYWRLKASEAREDLVSTVDLLWDLALRIEDGDLPELERALQAAQERLRQALEEGAPDEEIQRLMNELRQALSQYLQQLVEQARQNGMLTELPEGLGPDQMLRAQDLDQLLKKIEELARSGARDLAQRLLSELQDMLQRLQMGQFARDPRGEQMMQSLQGLGEIIKNQQQLLDDTFRAQRGDNGEGQEGQQGQQGQQGQGGRFGQLTQRQGDIRGRLDALLEQLRRLGAKPPEQLEGAGEAMNDAQRALEEGNLDRATQQQMLALDRLRQGTQQMAEQVLQQMIGQLGGRDPNAPRDPLGRPERTRGPDLGTSVKVPDEIDIQRAREILEELRRRLGDPNRPLLELDYLERLLRQY